MPGGPAEDANMEDAPPSHQPTVEEVEGDEQTNGAGDEEAADDYEEDEEEEPQRVKLVSTVVLRPLYSRD